METGTLHQLQVKKKKLKHTMCYIGLVILIIFLFLPPAFRLFIKEKSGEEKKKTVYISLNCEKIDESVTATFKDGIAENVMYKIKGNINERTLDTPDEGNVSNETADTDSNQMTVDSSLNSNESKSDLPFSDSDTLYTILSRFGTFTYDENENVSILRIPYTSLSAYKGYNEVFETVAGQENLYTSKGFSCLQSTF